MTMPDRALSPLTPPSGNGPDQRQLPRLGLTTDEAAQTLGLSRRTLEGWRVRGGGPSFVKLTRGVVRYRPDDLVAWLGTRVVDNTAQAAAIT